MQTYISVAARAVAVPKTNHTTRRLARFASLLALVGYSVGAHAQKVTWVASTEAEHWKVTENVRSAKVAGAATPLQIFADQPLQTMEGFGGCFNEAGWEVLQTLPAAKRGEILNELFAKRNSAYTWCRLPVASNDYSLSYYSYNDVAEDFGMRNFNIDRDRYILIPYIKAARQIAPDLQLWASPWSPPAWMKVNNHYSMGSQGNDQWATDMAKGRNIDNNATAFRMENRYLDAYALYLSKFVQAYAKEGLTIARLHVQNEIVYQPQWQSCTWRPEDLGYFIGSYLGPKFKAEQVGAEIWLGTVNTSNPAYIPTVLGNKKAAEYIKGIGMQWDAKQTIEAIHRDYPALPITQTESECGNGANDWKAAEYTWSLLRRYVGNGASSYMYWNMVLDETGRSTWGWVQNALITVNKTTGQVRYNPEFYLMKHLSHYVRPGARRLATSEGSHLAFRNADGSTVLLLVNTDGAAKTFTITLGAQQTTVTVQAKSFNTLRWPG